jgi:uncharacterized membrane protein
MRRIMPSRYGEGAGGEMGPPGESRGVRSTAAIFKHPIHPMLVLFPVAFLVSALASDAAFMVTDDQFWARASQWLVGAGLVTGGIAAVFGLTDFVTIPRARNLPGWMHFLGNATILGLALANFLIRLDDRADAVAPVGVTLSSAIVAILLVTGWAGGELAYRHKVGVIPGAPEVIPDIRRRAA